MTNLLEMHDKKSVLFCSEAFCSKFLIHYGRPLSNKVPLGQKRKKEAKKHENKYKMSHWFQQNKIRIFSLNLLSFERPFPQLLCGMQIMLVSFFLKTIEKQ